MWLFTGMHTQECSNSVIVSTQIHVQASPSFENVSFVKSSRSAFTSLFFSDTDDQKEHLSPFFRHTRSKKNTYHRRSRINKISCNSIP
jgi:hypothetical protein